MPIKHKITIAEMRLRNKVSNILRRVIVDENPIVDDKEEKIWEIAIENFAESYGLSKYLKQVIKDQQRHEQLMAEVFGEKGFRYFVEIKKDDKDEYSSQTFLRIHFMKKMVI